MKKKSSYQGAVGLVIFAGLVAMGQAQIAGGSAYNQNQISGRVGALNNEKAKRLGEGVPSANEILVEANVLANVVADEYVAVFAVNTEGSTVDECQTKAAGTIQNLLVEFKKLGVAEKDTFVDFINQNKTYGYDIANNVAKEKEVGFELRKNISVHFTSRALIERCLTVAAKAGVYDLVKVDYIVRDLAKVQDKLVAAAAQVLKRKVLNYKELLGIEASGPRQILAEKYATYVPTELYDSYRAYESEEVANFYGRAQTVQTIRKARTFYFNGLDARGFDSVINPTVLEPVVQFSLYLKVRVKVSDGSVPAKGAAVAKKKRSGIRK